MTDKPLVSKWDKTFAMDDKTLNKRISEKQKVAKKEKEARMQRLKARIA